MHHNLARLGDGHALRPAYSTPVRIHADDSEFTSGQAREVDRLA
jgi:hypothetical protein